MFSSELTQFYLRTIFYIIGVSITKKVLPTKPSNLYIHKSFNVPVFLVFRGICCYDHSFSFEEEDWLLCHPDLSAMYHDSDPVTGVLLA